MDNWHVLTRLPHKLPGPSPAIGASLESLDEIIASCVSLVRFTMDDMTRDESWLFLLLGRRLKRRIHLSGAAGAVLGFLGGGAHTLDIAVTVVPEGEHEALFDAANGRGSEVSS